MKKNKKVSKVEKKAIKNEKKTRAVIKEAFRREGDENNSIPIVSKNIIRAIVKSVSLNKKLINAEKKQIKDWQTTYYQELFSKFKELVIKHNEIYQFESDDLTNKINTKKRELNALKTEIKVLNGIVEHA